jgi:hypothetical protein
MVKKIMIHDQNVTLKKKQVRFNIEYINDEKKIYEFQKDMLLFFFVTFFHYYRIFFYSTIEKIYS